MDVLHLLVFADPQLPIDRKISQLIEAMKSPNA